jgi:hypothetical protein
MLIAIMIIQPTVSITLTVRLTKRAAVYLSTVTSVEKEITVGGKILTRYTNPQVHEGVWKAIVHREEGEGAVKKVAEMMAQSPGRPPWRRDDDDDDEGEGKEDREGGRSLLGGPRCLSAKDVARVMCQLRVWSTTWKPLFGSFASIPVSMIESETEDEMVTRFSQSSFSSYSGVLNLQRLPREKRDASSTMLLLCTTTGGDDFNCRS